MKKGIILQFIIILIFLTCWNLLHLGYNFQKETYETELSKTPIVLFSYDYNFLKSLKIKTDSSYYILRTEIIKDTTIIKELTEIYQLDKAKNILSKYMVPSVMKIYPDGKYYKKNQKNELEKLITEEYWNITFNYNENFWITIQEKMELLKMIYKILNAAIVIFVLIIITSLRVFYESKSNHYWEIYRISGGYSNLRNKNFWMNTIILTIFPFILINALFYFANYLNYLNFEIDYQLWGIEFLTLFISFLISRIILGDKI